MSPQDTDVTYRIGADENGLGARLGPMLVTACLARVDQRGARWLRRKLSKRLARDLDDSKRLVSFGNHELGEGWARALVPGAQTPADLLRALSLLSVPELQSPCPRKAKAQCWTTSQEQFDADASTVRRLTAHLERMAANGVHIESVKAMPICVAELNQQRTDGLNRFTSDLHAMERLVLALRERAEQDVVAVCGKVGGITDYPKYFGPLSGRLHIVMEQKRSHSAYRLPGLGDIHFVQDADASDPLVMLASMVGKYLRELLMARISNFYTTRLDDVANASGYHDPVTERLVQLTSGTRKQIGIPQRCFVRASDA